MKPSHTQTPRLSRDAMLSGGSISTEPRPYLPFFVGLILGFILSGALQ